MVRGLFVGWKTPINLDVDRKVTKELVEELIVKLENSGLRVCACTLDLGMYVNSDA